MSADFEELARPVPAFRGSPGEAWRRAFCDTDRPIPLRAEQSSSPAESGRPCDEAPRDRIGGRGPRPRIDLPDRHRRIVRAWPQSSTSCASKIQSTLRCSRWRRTNSSRGCERSRASKGSTSSRQRRARLCSSSSVTPSRFWIGWRLRWARRGWVRTSCPSSLRHPSDTSALSSHHLAEASELPIGSSDAHSTNAPCNDRRVR